MPASDTRTVLARKIAVHAGVSLQDDDLAPKMEVGLSRAARRAAAPLEGLSLSMEPAEITLRADLETAIAALPEHGLVAATEDPAGHRGLLALEHTLVDALIEVQTTGRVEQTQGAPRPVTRIDEVLCRDFIDLMFSAFALETREIKGRDWPERISYGSQIKDRSQINLLLPARGYHLLQVSITASGLKTGKLLILLPTDPSLARALQQQAAAGSKRPEKRAETWADDVLKALGGAPMALQAVLMRLEMPLSKVEALADGDLIPFDRADLGSVALEDEGGHVFARGKLGQLGGRRAVRLGDGQAKAPDGMRTPGLAPTQQPAAMPQMAGLPDIGAPPDPLPDSGRAPSPMEPMMAEGLPDLPMGAGLDLDAPMPMDGTAEGLPDFPMAAFDPDAPIG